MIASLTGTLVAVDETSVVLDVGGVGYELGVSYTTLHTLPEVGTPAVMLYCRMRPTEQAINLYGFATKEERLVFDKLVSVTGVGPKVALAILSTFSPPDLAEIIASQDAKRMQSVPGVGKKMADRLLLELKGLFAAHEEFQKLAGMAGLSSLTANSVSGSAFSEATEALLGLGYSPKETEVALKAVVQDNEDMPCTEDLLRLALGRLGGGSHVGSK